MSGWKYPFYDIVVKKEKAAFNLARFKNINIKKKMASVEDVHKAKSLKVILKWGHYKLYNVDLKMSALFLESVHSMCSDLT